MDSINVIPNEANWDEFCKAWAEQEQIMQRTLDATSQARLEFMRDKLRDTSPLLAESVLQFVQACFIEDKRVVSAHSSVLQMLSRYLFVATTKETSDTINKTISQLSVEKSRQESSLQAASHTPIQNNYPSASAQQLNPGFFLPNTSATNKFPLQRSSTSLESLAENTLTHIDEILKAKTWRNDPPQQSASPTHHGTAEQTTPEQGQLYPASNMILSPSLKTPPVNTPVSSLNDEYQTPVEMPSAFPFPSPSNFPSRPSTQQPVTMSAVPAFNRIVEFPAHTKTRGPGKFYLMRCPVCQRFFETVQGCFTHLNQSDQAHAQALGPEIRHKTFGTAVAIAGIEITDAEAAAVNKHNAKRVELLQVGIPE
jgi:hypothetical protein